MIKVYNDTNIIWTQKKGYVEYQLNENLLGRIYWFLCLISEESLYQKPLNYIIWSQCLRLDQTSNDSGKLPTLENLKSFQSS